MSNDWGGMADKLRLPLPPDLVKHHPHTGRPYVPGFVAIDAANEIFGYQGWGYRVDAIQYVGPVTDAAGEVKGLGLYYATVTVTVEGALPRTDVGSTAVSSATADGHDTAIKGAVTDAMKRALRSFSSRFGNSLYDKDDPDNAPIRNGQRPAQAPSRPQAAPAAQRPAAPVPQTPATVPARVPDATVEAARRERTTEQVAAAGGPQTKEDLARVLAILDWPEKQQTAVLADLDRMLTQGWGEAEAVAKKYEQLPRKGAVKK